MQLRIKGKEMGSYSGRRLLYTFCFFMFCVINQRIETCSPLAGWRETFCNLTGVVMAVVILSHYRPGDFKRWKVPYLVWSVVGAAGAISFYILGLPLFEIYRKPFLYFANARAVAALDIFLFGYVLICTFIAVAVEKKVPKFHRKPAGVWLAMMALMIVSRSTYIWPFCYFLMFGCFYLTDYSEEEREDLFQGALDGILLSLFLIQGACFVFRPFDELRYVGAFSNSNHNALYYLFVLAAVFARIVSLTKQGCGRWRKLFYWLGAGVVYAFLFLTIGRTAWVVSFILGLCFLWALKVIQQKKAFIRQGLALILSFLVMFPVVFAMARYLPPVFHHPVWFFGDYSEEKVHSWDEWDSEKYTDLDEFLTTAVGRVLAIFDNLPFSIKAEAASPEEKYESMLEQGYALPKEQRRNPLAVRGAIYKYYVEHLNLFGHPYEEQGFQLFLDYWIGHAHDIFLQWGTDFGILVMALFIILVVMSVGKLYGAFARGKSEKKFGSLLFLLVTILFGVLEYSWGVGGLGVTMMFFAWGAVCVDEKR